MLAPLHKLHCFLKRVQMFLLFLGIAYLMAGSILLLQRSSSLLLLRGAAQSSLLLSSFSSTSGLPTAPSLAAPPTGLRGVRVGRPRWVSVQDVSGGGVAAATGTRWPAYRSIGVQHLHRRWFHSRPPEGSERRDAMRSRSSGHKGTYVGCFLHDTSEHALGGTMLYDLRKMTISLCHDTCSESGYQFAGLEYGAECHCGNRISSASAPEEDCSLVCRGERGSPCGGVGRLSIYKVEKQLPGHRKFRNVHYSGCFKIPERTVKAFTICSVQPNLTVHSCMEICIDKELPLAVLRKPHCFCTHTSTLLSLSLQQQQPPCLDGAGRNDTDAPPATASDPDEPGCYQVYHTPVLDSRCRERMFLPQKRRSLVALASFPGAGNTWVRHLVELVTGHYTGSFYFDGTLYNRGFKGEKDYWKSGRTICIKTHESGQKDIEMFDSAILLIRNPYRSLMAEFNRKCAGHLGHASDAQWKSKEWPEFVDSYAPWWASHALNWLKFDRRLLVVHYEELQSALFPQLRLITSFLNVTVTEERLLCAQSNQDGHFKRSGANRPSFDPFTPDMKRLIDSFVRTVDQALQERQFSGLPQDYLLR